MKWVRSGPWGGHDQRKWCQGDKNGAPHTTPGDHEGELACEKHVGAVVRAMACGSHRVPPNMVV